jgi:hypothetical protein
MHTPGESQNLTIPTYTYNPYPTLHQLLTTPTYMLKFNHVNLSLHKTKIFNPHHTRIIGLICSDKYLLYIVTLCRPRPAPHYPPVPVRPNLLGHPSVATTPPPSNRYLISVRPVRPQRPDPYSRQPRYLSLVQIRDPKNRENKRKTCFFSPRKR